MGKKVWIVNQYAIPPEQAGGTRHFSLAKKLNERGHEVTIIASSFDHVTRRETRLKKGELYRAETIDGVRFLWIRTPPYRGNSWARVWNMNVFAYRVWRIPNTLLQKPDVVVGSSPHLWAALAAERLATRFGVPFVFEVRDLWPQTLIDLGAFSARHPFVLLLEKMEWYLYQRASRIVTLLPKASEHICAKGGDPNRITWISNGVDLEMVPPPTPPQPKGVCTVMYAGTHGFANGLHILLEAISYLEQEGWGDKIHFRFVGDGPEKARLKEKSKQLGLRSISFEDPVPKNRVYTLLSEADVLAMVFLKSPLYRWGISPNKIFDYLAVARPVVLAVDAPLNPVEESGAGLVVSPDPVAIAKAIRQMALMSPEERWAIGLKGRRYVEVHYSWSCLAEKYEALIGEVLGGE
ncbi:glycosyltransferase family 4 protein [Thermus sp.]|uniref:glycosyltransferase family 4 protein n=1 Tax=Thermus sp. TaxID=275 RepID=UPI00307E7FC4